MINIPENFTEFLYWVKENTERFWNIDPKTSTNTFVCEDWIYGAKWIGLSETEIDAVEQKYSIRFTLEHREFLRILHTIDRREKREYVESFEEDSKILTEDVSLFYHWQEDEVEIKKKLNWPYETILQDVIGNNQVWLKSWGSRPSSEEEIKKIYSAWYEKAPKLVPVSSHRFSVSGTGLTYHPILSVWGSDIIVYGWNFRTYLLNELQYHLDTIHEMVYDEEDKCYYAELKEEIKDIFAKDYLFDEKKVIPSWQEMILFWSSGWSGFGLTYPSDNSSTVRPIVKTYIPEGGKNEQKTFTDFQ